MSTRPAALGRVLFRLRSFTPIPVIAVVIAVLVLRPAPPRATDALFIALGIVCCALGQGLRAWVLGTVPHGTSGQDAYLEAVSLNTHGPYAHVRNPLYVGNFGICLGVALVASNALAAAIGLGFFAAQYALVVAAEERFLRERFGAEFEAYCARVPRWSWRFRAACGSGLQSATHPAFDWRRALRKEHNPFCAWATGLLAIFALRMGHSAHALHLLAGAEVLLLVGYVAVKGWKRRWWLAGA